MCSKYWLPRCRSTSRNSTPRCQASRPYSAAAVQGKALAAAAPGLLTSVMSVLLSLSTSVDDVVAAVDMDRLAGDQPGGVGGEVGGGHADVVDRDQAARR